MTRRISILSALILCLGPSLAHAQNTVVFTTNTTIDIGDTTHDNKDIIVRGCTVTINGPHTLSSLSVERRAPNDNTAGVVTHAQGSVGGVQLTIIGNASIDSWSRIDASGKGFGINTGPGRGYVDSSGYGTGGSYGGEGGSSAASGRLGSTYGSYASPIDLGSGGGGPGAGAGGGAVRLSVGGVLSVDGYLLADGVQGNPGGSGGSLWITTGTLIGNGFISANGGYIYNDGCGSGGGGRVSVTTTSNLFLGFFRAYGGGNGYRAGAGSVYFKSAGSPNGNLIFDNRGSVGYTALPTMTINDPVTVRGAARLTHERGYQNWHLTCNSDFTLEQDARIDVSGRGSATNKGEGHGWMDDQGYMTGGSYGGSGGSTGRNGPLGPTYGSIMQPTDYGSGGSGPNGGPGGGAVRLTVNGTFDCAGFIEANGTQGNSGGSGGSIWIDADHLIGNGVIAALGGYVSNDGHGAGGGGRIAVYADSDQFTGFLRAWGGTNGNLGGAGSIYRKSGTGLGTVTFDNNGYAGDTELNSLDLNAHLVVSGQARLQPEKGVPMVLTVHGNCTIGFTGFIAAQGRGFPGNTGPGRGYGDSQLFASGGGYGGLGGPGAGNGTRGQTYGSQSQPIDLGSGGGGQSGAAGGGAIRLDVQGTLTVLGAIQANGNQGNAGGSGGSVYITCPTILGTGLIEASGGPVFNGGWGSGGGGRVAVYGDRTGFTGIFRALPGQNGNMGAAGTVFFGSLGYSISGIVALEGFAGTTGPSTVTFEFREPGTLNIIDTKTVPLAADGSYTVIAPGSGQYDMATKVFNWLRQKRNVNMASGNVTAFHFSLLNGDSDDDNEVGIGDYSLISGAFGTSLGDTGYDPAADIDWDGEVGIGDYSLLSANFGMTGDE